MQPDHSKSQPMDDKLSRNRRGHVTWFTLNFKALNILQEWLKLNSSNFLHREAISNVTKRMTYLPLNGRGSSHMTVLNLKFCHLRKAGCRMFNCWATCDKRPYRRGGGQILPQGKVISEQLMWYRPVRSNAVDVKQSSFWCHYWYFAAWTTAVTHTDWQWTGQPTKLPFFCGDLGRHLSLPKSPKPPSNGISIGSSISAGLMNVTNWQTDRHTYPQTDHATL